MPKLTLELPLDMTNFAAQFIQVLQRCSLMILKNTADLEMTGDQLPNNLNFILLIPQHMVPRVCTSVVAVVEFLSETCDIYFSVQNLRRLLQSKPTKKQTFSKFSQFLRSNVYSIFMQRIFLSEYQIRRIIFIPTYSISSILL